MGVALDHSGRFAPLPYHPAAPTAPGRDLDSDLTQMMAAQIVRTQPKSGSDALRELRAAFPDSPLALRVAALGMAMRQGHGDTYRPR
jgi:hypothetical protein